MADGSIYQSYFGSASFLFWGNLSSFHRGLFELSAKCELSRKLEMDISRLGLALHLSYPLYTILWKAV